MTAWITALAADLSTLYPYAWTRRVGSKTFQTSLSLQKNSMMSFTPEQIDQLISDHLDGRLSDDQSQWLAEQLRTDADLAQQLADAEFDRQMLRSLHQKTSTTSSLPADFASRVVAAAQQRALDDNLSSNHPLRKLPASAPVETVAPPSSRHTRRTWVAAIAGLAAAGLFVVTLQNRGNDPSPNNPLIDPSAAIAQADPTNLEPDPIAGLDSLGAPNIETIASSDLPNVDREGLSPAAIPSVDPTAAGMDGSNEPSGRPQPERSSIASATDQLNTAPVDMSATVAAGNSNEVQSLSGAVLIYDVQLKPEARDPGVRNHFAMDSDPVRKAMTTAGLAASSKQLVNKRLIEATRESVTLDDDTRYQILLLRGPAKQLDRLFLELLADEDSIESVGMSMAMGNAVSGIAWQQEENVVPSNAVAYDLNTDDRRSLQRLGMALSNRDFMPVQAESFTKRIDFALGSPEAASTGNDFITEVLVIVR
ncbi:anti-sigma factor family protein [Rhodopirellula sp. P2]|uniref:anti-sigma factor family protein n=1 Tax=Rhodopirellula sp. P2 TaxID=2127060 RepID=UPI002367ACF9|nr:hypothetical protein [Rhodopirellula sp. P2]WDQ17645.1 hypothetical protein PSR62_03610 [Rhodopirellula sp. P2]